MIGFKTLEENTFDWCSWTYLPGHSFGMVGIKTDDGVWFLGDAYLGRRLLDRNPFGFIYNVEAYLETLDKVKKSGREFIYSISRRDRGGHKRDRGNEQGKCSGDR